MKQETYRRIVSGKAGGPAAAAARLVFAALSGLYGLIIRIRNRCYDLRLLKSHSAPVPVISIGNLTAGGTGKTPLVIWLARCLEQRQIKPAILTRGYKTRQGSLSDEPALLAKACGDTPVIVNPDRAAGAQKAVEHHQAQVLIMDDGFQHRRLARDLDIVTIDATCPFGYGKILPAGLLREPVDSLKRAGLAVVTRSDQVPQEKLEEILAKIHQVCPDLPVVRSVHRICCGKAVGSQTIALETLQSKKLFAFCGLGNPTAFLDGLKKQGFEVVGNRIFDDHHVYSRQDLDGLHEQARSLGAQMLVTTEKDWVKAALLAGIKEQIPLVYLALELDFPDSADTMDTMLDELFKKSELNRTPA